ncbi:MAG: cytochrome c peroxidase [Acidobacteriota bacterium]
MKTPLHYSLPARFFALSFLLTATYLSACKTAAPEAPMFQPEIIALPAEIAKYEPMATPATNPQTPEKAALGRQLFFDPRLSVDGSKSCSSCHVCANGLTDGLPKAIGPGNKTLRRSSPTLWNIGYHKEFYWDGRSPSLEGQGKAAWLGGNMGAKDHEAEILAKISAVPGYQQQFKTVFNAEPSVDTIFQAISSYERTIISGNASSAFDRWQEGDQTAVNDEVKRGYEVFKKAKCDACHSGVLLTDLQYHNTGVGMDAPEDKLDKGRFDATKVEKDTGAFKTPTLRDVAKSAPYFHDGSVATLEAAVDHMLAGGKPNKYLDTANLKKVALSPKEKAELLSFLRSLNVDRCGVVAPLIP